MCCSIYPSIHPSIHPSIPVPNPCPCFPPLHPVTCAAASWSAFSSEGYIGAEVMALVSFVIYLLFTIILVVLQSAVSDQLGGIGELACAFV